MELVEITHDGEINAPENVLLVDWRSLDSYVDNWTGFDVSTQNLIWEEVVWLEEVLRNEGYNDVADEIERQVIDKIAS